MDIDSGETKSLSNLKNVSTYNTAQKMRAAMSHQYGRVFKHGMQPFTENPIKPGTYNGNPSMSDDISQYMISLRRRKVRGGETVVSAKAMEEKTLEALYKYNLQYLREANAPSYSEAKKGKRGDGNGEGIDSEGKSTWAGCNVRMMLWFFYTISFLCLLRCDEALRIRWEDISVEEWLDDGEKSIRLKVTLPFRKTHQTGGVLPFYLYPDRQRPHLCPVTAFCVWYNIVSTRFGSCTGYVFRKRTGKNGVSADSGESLSHASLMESFKNNLMDISVNPDPYGTHSFRRGGAQWLAMVKRWPYRNICSWAGWSDNLDNPATLFKYLLSVVDAPIVKREEYMDPHRLGGDKCGVCGRSCPCA
ncbi:hypothetical protein SCHPADRAFT_838709 [Schizopora paradoxa]|uniref:DNA breaking-rejoining enzyme n=1 Tax=Schizopora paradoxa TaxID=27342 RepID=A0A0H2R2D7_9AGAM|nr:hypothetical protein SCHPADRAFT_838709 [Schizopora paradoxa]